MFGTCSARDRAAVERLGAAAIDYRNEELRKGNSITGDPGGRLETMGAYNTLAKGRKSMRA